MNKLRHKELISDFPSGGCCEDQGRRCVWKQCWENHKDRRNADDDQGSSRNARHRHHLPLTPERCRSKGNHSTPVSSSFLSLPPPNSSSSTPSPSLPQHITPLRPQFSIFPFKLLYNMPSFRCKNCKDEMCKDLISYPTRLHRVEQKTSAD